MTKAISLSALVALSLLIAPAAHAGTEFDYNIGNIKSESAGINATELRGFAIGLSDPHINYGGFNQQLFQNQSILNFDLSRLDSGTTSYNNSTKISDDIATITALNGHTVDDFLKFQTVGNNRTKALGLVADVNTTYSNVIKTQGVLTADVHKGRVR